MMTVAVIRQLRMYQMMKNADDANKYDLDDCFFDHFQTVSDNNSEYMTMSETSKADTIVVYNMAYVAEEKQGQMSRIFIIVRIIRKFLWSELTDVKKKWLFQAYK